MGGMNYLSNARGALVAEIKRLQADIDKLNRILKQLDGEAVSAPVRDAAPAAAGRRKRRPGRPRKQPDPQAALDVIKAAGKNGINVMSLNAQLRHAGHPNAPREALVASGKIKLTGKAGGATYTWVG